MRRNDSKLWIRIASIISALIIISAYFFIRFEITKTNQTKGKELEAIARLKSDQVASWLLDEKQDVAVIAQNVLLIEKVRHFLKDSSFHNEKEIITYFQSVLNEHGFEHVLLTDTAGTIMTTSVGNDYSTDPYLFKKIKQTIHSRLVTTTDLYACLIHDTIHVDFIAPILDADQNVLGTLIFQENPYHFLFPLIESWPTLSKSSETLLYKIVGDSILFLNELKHKKNTAIKFAIPLSAKDVVAVKAANSPDGIIEGIDYAGNKVIAYVVKVPQTEWIMVSKTDKKELFSSLYYEIAFIIFMVILILIILAVGMAYLYNLREKKVYKEFYKSQENYHITLKSIGDAVISTNNRGEVEYLNPVAEKLTGWSIKDAVGKKLNQVFKIINEESRSEVESPVNKVLREGIIVGLANHTLLLSKEGIETPIADSGAPIRNEKGEITGVVLVFRDQTEEREYQKKIARSEAQYRELIESTDAIAWEYDIPMDKWVYVAPQVSDQLGWLPEEWTNLDFWKNNIHPDERESSADYCSVCTRKGESHSLEYRFKCKAGNYVWLRDVVMVEMKENNPVKMRGVMFDITETKKNQIALERSNKNWQTLTKATRILNSELEPKIILRQLVASAIELTGAQEGTAGIKIDGKMVFKEYNAHGNIMPIDYSFKEGYGVPGHVLKTKKAYLSNNAENDKYVISDIQRKLGFYNLIDTPIIDRYGNVIGCFELHNKPSGFDDYDLILLQNLAAGTAIALENSNIVEQLQESEERFRKAILLAPIPIMVHDEDGKVINVSEGWTHFSGYSIEDIPTMKAWTEKAYGEKAKEVEEYVSNLFNEKATIESGEFEIISKSGEKRVWNFYTTPLGKLSSGKIIMLSMAPDITQRKRAQEELIEAKDKAEESERLKTAFLANMSHEIRTPLNGILGFTNLLIEDKTLTQSQKKNFGKIINKSGEGLLKIISDILDISRLETGKSSILNDPFEISGTLSTIYSIFNKKLTDSGKKSVELIVKKPDASLTLDTDETRLIQIFSNLLDNALRFTSKGAVTFGISERKEDKVEFFVSDTGFGISKEKHEIIFERFSQADDNYTRSYGGTGLGLAIAKKLLEMMGGAIKVESEIEKGTCFRFWLPYTQLSKSKNKLSVKNKNTDLKINNSRILVVEDDPVSELFFKQVLGNQFAELKFARTGKDALMCFESEKLDIILMDIGLPDMNGLDVIRRIRQKNTEVYIITQTAYAMQSDKQESIDAGSNDFITKPIDTEHLMKKLTRVNRSA